MLETLIKYSKYSGVKSSGARKLSIQINALVAVIYALRSVIAKHGSLASERIPVAIRDLVEVIILFFGVFTYKSIMLIRLICRSLCSFRCFCFCFFPFSITFALWKDSLVSSVGLIRGLASETLGLLCRVVSSGGFMNQLMQTLVDQIVNDRDPNSRAGCVLALGCIHSNAGGMAIGSHLKTSVGIMHSLASDAHPLVHTWALYSLWLTIESSGLMFGPFVNSTLSLMTKLMMSESHDIAVGGPLITGTDNNLDVLPILGRILHAITGVLGPELQSLSRVRELCFSLFEEFKNDSDFFVAAEAIKSIQQLILFAPKYVDVPTLIPFLQQQLGGSNQQQVYLMRKAAVTCLYQLTRKDPSLVLSAAVNRQLEEQLFALLDIETDHAVRDEIKDILVCLLRHVAPENPSRWLELSKGILAKGGSVGATRATETGASIMHDDDDDDVEVDADFRKDLSSPSRPSPQVSAAPKPSPQQSAPMVQVLLLPRWQTQVFALSCLREVMSVCSSSNKQEHFDLALARKMTPGTDMLVSKVADLIRMAFNSATAPVHNLRLEGLFLLQNILEV